VVAHVVVYFPLKKSIKFADLQQLNLADLPPFVTVEEIARAVRVHDETIRVIIKKKVLPGTKIGRQWRVKRDDVLAFLQARGALLSDSLSKPSSRKPAAERHAA
jgi:excisionase family DNA binding protein